MARRRGHGLVLAAAILLLATSSVQAQRLTDLLERAVDEFQNAVEAVDEGEFDSASREGDLAERERVEAQAALNAIGFDVGTPDGKFGPMTRRGITAFQESYGYEPTGELTREQFERLLRAEIEGVGTAGQTENGGPEVVEAATASDAAADTFRTLGLEVRNGEILAASTAISIDKHAEGIKRLQLLLLLIVRPEALEDRNYTERFAEILPDSILDEYLLRRPRTWKGDSQFEQEDTRLRFLDEQRDTILAMRPKLPLTIVDIRAFRPGQYDFDRQQMPVEISRYEPWISLGFANFDGPIPAELPDRIDLPTEIARQIVEGTVAGAESIDPEEYRPSAALRYVVRAARPSGSGVALDIAVLDMTLFADRDLTVRIMALPLGPETAYDRGAATEEPAVAAAGEPAIPFFDATVARLLATNIDPTLADDSSFFRESFAVRRTAEADFISGDESPLNFRRVMPAVLLNDDGLRPADSDDADFSAWFAESRALVADLMTFPDNLVWEKRLSAIAGGIGTTPSRENTALIRELWPNSVDFGRFKAGRDLMVLYALHPSSYWNDTSILAGTGEHDTANLTVRIRDSRLQTIGGVRYLMLELLPEHVTVISAGLSETTLLPELAEPSIASLSDGSTPASRFEVLGVKLGMPVDEARQIIEAAYAGKPLDPFVPDSGPLSPCDVIESRAARTIRGLLRDIDYQQDLGARPGETVNAVMVTALEGQLAAARETLAADLAAEGCQPETASPLQFAFGYNVAHTRDLTERIVVFRVGEMLGEPVVSAIFRSFTPSEIGDRFMAGLVESYGPGFVPFENGSDEVAWPDDPQLAARFGENGDERCSSFWRGDDGFPHRYLDVNCGAYLRAGPWRMVLIDTRYTSRVFIERQQAAAAAVVEPEIKF